LSQIESLGVQKERRKSGLINLIASFSVYCYFTARYFWRIKCKKGTCRWQMIDALGAVVLVIRQSIKVLMDRGESLVLLMILKSLLMVLVSQLYR